MPDTNFITRIWHFIRELKRRKIFRVIIVYCGVAFVALQVTDLMIPALNLPRWTISFVFILLAIGFVIAVISAWAFEVTPDGVVRITDSENAEASESPHGGKPFTGDPVIISLLIIIAGILLYPNVISPDSAQNTENNNVVSADSLKAESNEFTPQLGQRSIAVLPFTHLAAEDSTDYFSLGITDELLSRIAQLKQLAVIGRTSVMQYQDTDKTLREIGRELGVAHLLEGSVQLVGSQVRIQAQLIQAEDGTHLWAETYNREIKNILDLQSDVANRIVKSLEAELFSKEPGSLKDRPVVNEEAYHLYLRGLHMMESRDSTGLVRATKLFSKAIARDSSFAPAYSGLSLATFHASLFGWMSAEPKKQLEIADKALELDSTTVPAHLTKALVYTYFHRNWNKSEQTFKKALQFNPSHSEVRREYGWSLLHLGQIDSAFVQMKRAVELDPRSWHAHHSLGYTYYCKKQYQEAIQTLETAINLGSQYPATKTYLLFTLLKQSQRLMRQGRDEKAEAILERVSKRVATNEYGHILEPVSRVATNEYGQYLILAVRGREKKIAELTSSQKVDPFSGMLLNLLAGRVEPALNLMEQANPGFQGFVFMDPIYTPVREDPRFERIVEQVIGRNVINP